MSDELKCTPHCIYFPNPDIVSWKWSEDGTYKVSATQRDFYCKYDGHKIDNWNIVCPKKMDENFRSK